MIIRQSSRIKKKKRINNISSGMEINKRLIKIFLPVFSVLVLAHLLWFTLTNIFGIQKIFIPSPIETYRTLLRSLFLLKFWQDIGASWFRVTVAFLLSFFVAYPLVLGSVLSDSLKRALFFIAEFFRYLPVPVFIPMTILWFGVSDTGKIMVVFLGTFAQMIPMFYDSTMLVRNSYGAANAALKWNSMDIVQRIILKGSAPYIFDNARLCLGWAWTYLVVAELLGAKHGIGYAIIRAQRYLATDRVFAYIIIIGVMGILTDRLMHIGRKRLFPWA